MKYSNYAFLIQRGKSQFFDGKMKAGVFSVVVDSDGINKHSVPWEVETSV